MYVQMYVVVPVYGNGYLYVYVYVYVYMYVYVYVYMYVYMYVYVYVYVYAYVYVTPQASMLKTLMPSNALEEKEKFFLNNGNYNPQFRYASPIPYSTLKQFGTPKHEWVQAAVRVLDTVIDTYGSYEEVG